MTNFEDGYKKSWQATRCYQYTTGEWYDSRLEGNDIALLDLLGGIEFESSGLTFIVPFLRGGSFKPDLWYACQRNGETSIRTAKKPMVLVEIKGWDKGLENQLKRDFIQDLVDDPSDEVIEGYWQMRDDLGIMGYDGKSKDWEPAGVYTCPRCGHTFYKVKTRHTCPYCGEAGTTFITDKANSKFNEWWKQISDATCDRIAELTNQGKRAYYKQIADEVIADFKSKIRPHNTNLAAHWDSELKPELKGIDFKELVSDAYKLG